jgi:transcriptional regulator with XRE-family HTH domain
MRISQARKDKGWTQERLASELGVSRGAVAQWEMEEGTRPDPNNARRLMALLPGLTFDDIYPPVGQEAA